MGKIDDLQQQAVRAERLAKDVTDKLTVERLQSFAAECRKQAKALNENQTQAASAASFL
jgi:hypothetical protein